MRKRPHRRRWLAGLVLAIRKDVLGRGDVAAGAAVFAVRELLYSSAYAVFERRWGEYRRSDRRWSTMDWIRPGSGAVLLWAMVIDALTLRASDGAGPCVSKAAMTIHREQMMKAVRAVFVPVLRQRGFVGSFPHFRRKLDQRIDFLNVQFNRYGGSFCLNIGQTGPDGLEDPDWPDLSLAATTVGHLRYRSRVGRGFLAKQWFEFGPKSDNASKPARPVSFYEGIASDAVRAFEKDGERWFNKQPAVQVK